MKRITLSVLLLAALLLATSSVLADSMAPTNFVAVLSGDNEVPARPTLARGTAIFQLSNDGTLLDYKLIAANIHNVFASHIHCGPIGENGPVGATLYSGAPASGRFDGVLAEGVITAPNAGNGCGWVTLDDVFAAMVSGDTYVNVHTNDGVAPINTGPGDFPGGEIRGQIFLAGASQ